MGRGLKRCWFKFWKQKNISERNNCWKWGSKTLIIVATHCALIPCRLFLGAFGGVIPKPWSWIPCLAAWAEDPLAGYTGSRCGCWSDVHMGKGNQLVDLVLGRKILILCSVLRDSKVSMKKKISPFIETFFIFLLFLFLLDTLHFLDLPTIFAYQTCTIWLIYT